MFITSCISESKWNQIFSSYFHTWSGATGWGDEKKVNKNHSDYKLQAIDGISFIIYFLLAIIEWITHKNQMISFVEYASTM